LSAASETMGERQSAHTIRPDFISDISLST
jgi:hypothetical protein